MQYNLLCQELYTKAGQKPRTETDREAEFPARTADTGLSRSYRPGAAASPLAAKMIGVAVKMGEVLRRPPIAGMPNALATYETPISIDEQVAWARARRNSRNHWRRNHYRRWHSDADSKRNAWRGEYCAARQKQSR